MAQSSSGEPNRGLTKEEQFEKALRSSIAELPENKPRGLLGEQGVDIRKVDDFTPDLNAGISQEIDTPVVWAAILLGYLFFFVPGFVILWLSKRFDARTKMMTSVVMVAVAVAFVAYVSVPRSPRPRLSPHAPVGYTFRARRARSSGDPERRE